MNGINVNKCFNFVVRSDFYWIGDRIIFVFKVNGIVGNGRVSLKCKNFIIRI